MNALSDLVSAPHELGGMVYIPPGLSPEEHHRTVAHEGVHATISKIIQALGPLGAGPQLARVAVGTLPDELNPEEELAYRLEPSATPGSPGSYTAQLRKASRSTRKGPVAAFLRALYGD